MFNLIHCDRATDTLSFKDKNLRMEGWMFLGSFELLIISVCSRKTSFQKPHWPTHAPFKVIREAVTDI